MDLTHFNVDDVREIVSEVLRDVCYSRVALGKQFIQCKKINDDSIEWCKQIQDMYGENHYLKPDETGWDDDVCYIRLSEIKSFNFHTLDKEDGTVYLFVLFEYKDFVYISPDCYSFNLETDSECV